jgi:acetyl esterase/lipase
MYLDRRRTRHFGAFSTPCIVAWVAAAMLGPQASPAQSTSSEVQPKTILLWTGEPTSSESSTSEAPIAKLYLAKTKNSHGTPMLVVCPGGGYGGLAADHEGDQIARWANDINMSALICYYRHRGQGVGHPVPLQDAQRAIRLARAQATEWNVNPSKVGIMGFSAGGHLASTVLTHFDAGLGDKADPVAKQSSRPDFGILCYPVIGMGKPYTHEGSQRNLLGESPDPQWIAALSNEEQVTAQTPPTFLWHTSEDKAVLTENSIFFYAAMVKHHVPGELHIFEKGEHGVGLARDIPGTEAWSRLCENWLRTRGIL